MIYTKHNLNWCWISKCWRRLQKLLEKSKCRSVAYTSETWTHAWVFAHGVIHYTRSSGFKTAWKKHRNRSASSQHGIMISWVKFFYSRRLVVATNSCSVTRSLKLSNVEPGEYLDGRPPWKTERCESAFRSSVWTLICDRPIAVM